MQKRWFGSELRIRADTNEEKEILNKMYEMLDLLGIATVRHVAGQYYYDDEFHDKLPDGYRKYYYAGKWHDKLPDGQDSQEYT